MEIDGSGVVSTTGGGSSAPNGGDELNKASFLTLLVAQMKHQDPLQPMDNTEFVAQLAQFSGVEQLMQMNEGVEILQIQQMGLANAQASSFIGKEVEVKSDTIDVSSTDQSATAGFDLAGDAESVTVNFRDATGGVVRTIELGPTQAGETKVDWDCRDDNGNMVPPGAYRIDIVAKDGEDNPVTWEARVRGIVEGVVYENGYPELLIGSIRAELSEIRAVYPGGSEMSRLMRNTQLEELLNKEE